MRTWIVAILTALLIVITTMLFLSWLVKPEAETTILSSPTSINWPDALPEIKFCGPEGVKETVQIIDDSNFCEVDADCEQLRSQCPFGCGIVVNSSKAEFVQDAISEYLKTQRRLCEKRCVYSCVASTGVACINKKCKALSNLLKNYRDFQWSKD